MNLLKLKLLILKQPSLILSLLTVLSPILCMLNLLFFGHIFSALGLIPPLVSESLGETPYIPENIAYSPTIMPGIEQTLPNTLPASFSITDFLTISTLLGGIVASGILLLRLVKYLTNFSVQPSDTSNSELPLYITDLELQEIISNIPDFVDFSVNGLTFSLVLKYVLAFPIELLVDKPGLSVYNNVLLIQKLQQLQIFSSPEIFECLLEIYEIAETKGYILPEMEANWTHFLASWATYDNFLAGTDSTLQKTDSNFKLLLELYKAMLHKPVHI